MKIQPAFIALLFAATASFADQTPSGDVNLDTGRIIVNGERLSITRQYDGKQVELTSEYLVATTGKNPGFILSLHLDGQKPRPSLTQHLIVIDATGKELRRSNVLDSGIRFDWGDNNYVRFEGNAMYFGIYAPKRMQFVYRDGTVAEDKGPWHGPAKAEKYIEPKGEDPCGNVNGVEDCRAEVARDKARHAKVKPKASKQKASTAP